MEKMEWKELGEGKWKLRKKRLLTLVLALALGALTVGCGDKPGDTPGGEGGQGSAGDAGSPVQDGSSQETGNSGETRKITIALQQNTLVEDYETNYMTQKIEEDLNIEIEFMFLPADSNDAKTKISLMANGTGDMPDVIMMNMTGTEVAQYGAAGVFLPLEEYLADASLMPNINALKEEYPEDMDVILPAITSPDGHIYSLFGWFPEDWNYVPFRCWINKTWLDNLKLEIPTTTEEFMAVMEAFATRDPNGNGIQDEIPFTGSDKIWGGYSPYFLINAFVFYNGNTQNGGLALGEDGKVMAPFTTSEWLEAVKYMHEMCSNGLLDPAIFTMDEAAMRALLDSPTNIVGCTCAGGWGYWSGGLDNENFKDFVMLPPLKGPEGTAYAAAFEYTPNRCFYVTKNCQDPEFAMTVADWFFQNENSLTVRNGEQGVDWSIDEADTSTRTALFASQGYDCTLAILNDVWGVVQNKMWKDVDLRYNNIKYSRGKDAMIIDNDTRNADYRAQSYSIYSDAHPKLLPNLVYTEEESKAISEAQTNITDYVKNQLAEFVTGNKSLEEWDSYLEELDKMGLQKWLDTAQTAYERMTK